MPSNPEPTAAEKAAAMAIVEHWTPLDGDPDLTVEDVADEARAVVAAVRNLLAAEALRAEADILERAVPSEDAMPTMFVVPAHIWLRDRAEIRLRVAAADQSGEATE
jgi:hypothetical protein